MPVLRECVPPAQNFAITDYPADYPAVHTSWEGLECINHSPLLYAYGVTNVAITGCGLTVRELFGDRPPSGT